MKINYIIEKILLPLRILKFRLKIKGFKSKNYNSFKKIDKKIEKKHINLWKNLFPHINCSWLRFYSNVSGNADYRYVPEDIFYSIIERRLNDVNYSQQVADKSNYDIMFNKNLFPINYIKNISGIYLNSKNNIINYKEASEIIKDLKTSFIIKPTIESGGGKNVKIFNPKKNKISLNEIENYYNSNFLVQERIAQNNFFAKFNRSSLNSLRVLTYRSVINESIKVLSIVFRIGRKGMHVDNQAAGGISVGVDINSGQLKEYAVSKYGKKFKKHPDSNIIFHGKYIPNFNSIIKSVKKVALQIPSQRLLSFDATIDLNENVKIIEINTIGVEINFYQLQGNSLFRNYTNEIINYCKQKKLDKFKYLRITS